MKMLSSRKFSSLLSLFISARTTSGNNNLTTDRQTEKRESRVALKTRTPGAFHPTFYTLVLSSYIPFYLFFSFLFFSLHCPPLTTAQPPSPPSIHISTSPTSLLLFYSPLTPTIFPLLFLLQQPLPVNPLTIFNSSSSSTTAHTHSLFPEPIPFSFSSSHPSLSQIPTLLPIMTRSLSIILFAAVAAVAMMASETVDAQASKPECAPIHVVYKSFTNNCTQNGASIPNSDADPRWIPCVCKPGNIDYSWIFFLLYWTREGSVMRKEGSKERREM